LAAVHGPPETLLSDQGPQFTSAFWEEFGRRVGVKNVKHTTAYRPNVNGKVERLNGTLVSVCKKLVGRRQRDWDLYLQEAVAHVMHAPNASTKESPYFLAFGQEPRFALEQEIALARARAAPSGLTLTADGREILESVDRIVSEAARNAHEAAEARKAVWEREHRAPPPKFAAGAFVLYWRPAIEKGRSKKFAELWKGPFRVVRALGDTTYEIELVARPDEKHKVHVSRIKAYRERPGDVVPPEHFIIEEIVDRRHRKRGVEYLVKWRNFSAAANSWVRAADMNADELVASFERAREAAPVVLAVALAAAVPAQLGDAERAPPPPGVSPIAGTSVSVTSRPDLGRD
jgi:transposase InsO family protein